jgi:hypothetical protein
LEDELKDAATQQHFERAAHVRDKFVRLDYLWNRLAALRERPLPEQFVYSAQVGKRSMWFLVAASRVVRVVAAPMERASAVKSMNGLRAIYDASAGATHTSDRLATQILAGWFRSRPDELRATMTPGDALEVCRRACA